MNKFNNIIIRFLNTQVLLTFFAFFIVISLIIFGNQFFLVLNRSLSAGYYGSELFQLMTLKYIRDTPFVISFSFSLATIYSLNRLYRNSEMVILTNSGAGDYKLFKILLPVIILIFLIVSFLISYVVPKVNKEINFIKNDASSRPDYIFFKEGVFQNFKNENFVFYAHKIENSDENQIMKNIFLFSAADNELILSETGEKIFSDLTGKVFLRLFNGKIYHNIGGNSIGDLSISDFKKFEILLYEPNIANEIKPINQAETENTYTLMTTYNNENFRELFFRLSISISFIVISFFSIQISKSNPRRTRNYSLGYGLLIYIGYYNLLLYTKEIGELNSYEIMLTFLSAHLPFLVLVLIIIFFRNNFSIRRKF